MRYYKIIAWGIICSLMVSNHVNADEWRSHLAYNNVTQIAMSSDHVYAVSDGSLFSVDKQTEAIRLYDRMSGLHGTDITCIAYDEIGEQLIIGYGTGMIDIIGSQGMIFVHELYEKDMTQRKTITNVTIVDRIAYLSTPYGVQTMDLDEKTLIDSYWLRPDGQETHVVDVLIANDSIYAFTSDSLFSASLQSDLMNYVYWKREARSARIQPDAEKGKHYKDDTSDWYAGGSDGIVRDSETDGRISYKPQGPLVNKPYRMHFAQGKLFVVPGGRWASQNKTPGVVMIYDENQWQNISNASIIASVGNPVLDFMNVALDPNDPYHYFITSFGTGLYEFRGTQCIKRYYPAEDNTLGSASASNPTNYTRLDGATYDAEGNLWFLNAGNVQYQIQCLDTAGNWHGIPLKLNGELRTMPTPHGLIFDNRDTNRIWACSARSNKVGIYLMDSNSTPYDPSDDRVQFYNSWVDQYGHSFDPSEIYQIMQDDLGRLWMATELGVAYIDSETDFFSSNDIIRPDIVDETGENPLTTQVFNALCQTLDGRIWLGSLTLGVYAITHDARQLHSHYTTGNSALPSNAILSLAAGDKENIFIGTGNGLVELNYDGSSQGGVGIPWEKDSTISTGNMKNWKTYFSYNNISHIEDAGDKAYCLAEGALLGIDKSSEETLALSKLTGLTGSNAQLVAYNKDTRKTIAVYQNGQIDIIYPDGEIKNMLDVFLTTETHPTDFYSIYSHKDHVYICSSLGVINVNMSKNEISETYVLMDDKQKEQKIYFISIIDNTIYACTDKRIYTSSFDKNLVDYASWQLMSTPFSSAIKTMGSGHGYLYVQTGKILYRYYNSQWKKIQTAHSWSKVFIHPQSVLLQSDKGLVFELTGDESEQLNIPYTTISDILRNGQDYWVAIEGEGLVKWNHTNGTQQFSINSPCSNLSYRLRATDDKLIMMPGGYFASSYLRDANVMVLENGWWRNYSHSDIKEKLGYEIKDLCDAAVDPNDPSHFFIASFGYGLLEFRNNEIYKHYMHYDPNIGLESRLDKKFGYTWVDGLTYDAEGNLWMTNISQSKRNVKVWMKNGMWVGFDNAAVDGLLRSQDLLIWNQNQNIKIVTCLRTSQGIGVFNDNGTIANKSDDRAVFTNTFYDQNEKPIAPQYIYSICQMANGEVWVGTESGLFILPDVRNMLNHDFHCRRIIIPRNDGTGLGDYLLGEEQINAIAEDAAGRKWIGTETSGLYLVSEDGLETIEHFTKYNSPLISDDIYTIAIQPNTGEVFVGTSIGLLSYQSDANEAKEDMSEAYAYPNPVSPNYQGFISITGLMENTEVRIVDAGGNLICKTRSNGGLAVWDGKDANGKRATPGIYTAVCNAQGGHKVVKIMIAR